MLVVRIAGVFRLRIERKMIGKRKRGNPYCFLFCVLSVHLYCRQRLDGVIICTNEKWLSWDSLRSIFSVTSNSCDQ